MAWCLSWVIGAMIGILHGREPGGGEDAHVLTGLLVLMSDDSRVLDTPFAFL